LNEAVLKKTRLWTLAVATGLSLIFGIVFSIRFAAGIFLTALWAVAGFWALEGLLRSAIVPPGVRRNSRSVLLWAAAKIAVYGLAIWAVLRSPFPPVSHLIGFTLLLVVLVVVGASALPPGAGQTSGRGDNG
jgi:hypothetical protein